MDPKIGRRRGPQNRTGGEVHKDVSDAVREFKDHTAGLSNRLPLSSLEAMRAGTIASPHTLTRRYLMAAHRIGLPKAWALRFHVWVGRQIEALWPQEQTPITELRRRALRAESLANAAELECLTGAHPDALQRERDALAAEIVADQALLAKMDRALETGEPVR